MVRSLRDSKRNFHIFERTGIFERVNREGLALLSDDNRKAYHYAKIIGNMNSDFLGFESCYGAKNVSDAVCSVVLSSKWGKYYDSLTLPMDILSELSDDVDVSDAILAAAPIGTLELGDDRVFPALRAFQTNQVRAFSPSANQADPFETIIRREKANREHSRILAMLAAKLRANNHTPYENVFVDLYTQVADQEYIFEVKSNNLRNALSQIRKAIAQLYEYRYRSNKNGATLCIVLQQKPSQDWVEDYLLHDRGIMMCWLVDDVRLECPIECYPVLASIGIVE